MSQKHKREERFSLGDSGFLALSDSELNIQRKREILPFSKLSGKSHRVKEKVQTGHEKHSPTLPGPTPVCRLLSAPSLPIS